MRLVSYRTAVPRTFLGFLFGLDDRNVSRSNRRRAPLPASIFRVPERKVAVRREEIAELFLDGTGRPTGRPARGQRRYYSGEKRRHTLQVRVAVVRGRKRLGRGGQQRKVRIAAVSPVFPGSTHDKRVFDRAGVVTPPGVTGYGDTAYLGTGLTTPARKPRGGSLTARQRAGNRRVGRKRIAAEHRIGKMKVWRVAAERWRNPRRRHTLATTNVAGLHHRMYGE